MVSITGFMEIDVLLLMRLKPAGPRMISCSTGRQPSGPQPDTGVYVLVRVCGCTRVSVLVCFTCQCAADGCRDDQHSAAGGKGRGLLNRSGAQDLKQTLPQIFSTNTIHYL